MSLDNYQVKKVKKLLTYNKKKLGEKSEKTFYLFYFLL